jgi:hypothetical protein
MRRWRNINVPRDPLGTGRSHNPQHGAQTAVFAERIKSEASLSGKTQLSRTTARDFCAQLVDKTSSKCRSSAVTGSDAGE